MSEALLDEREATKTESRHAQIWKALAKYNIRTEAELNAAIKKTKPLNIGCMVSPVKKKGASAK